MNLLQNNKLFDPQDVLSCVSDQGLIIMSSSIWPSTILENFLEDTKVKPQHFLLAVLPEVR